MFKKVLSCTALGFLVAFSPLSGATSEKAVKVSAATTSFHDVSSAYWANKEIAYLSSKSIINGYRGAKGSYFAPEDSVTRAQAAKMILIAAGEKQATVSKTRFPDVPKDEHWAAGWIERAVQLNIFTGKPDGTFGPEETMTRDQMSKVLVNSFDVPIPSKTVEPFRDVWINHWYYPFVNGLYNEGITTGSNGLYYKPSDSLTRAQFSVFLARLLNPDYRVKTTNSEGSDGIEENTSNGSDSAETQTPVSSSVKTVAVSLSSGLNVRSGSSTSNEVIGQLSKGQTVPLISVEGNWAKVQLGNKTGYVSKLYVKLRNVAGSPVANRIIVIDAGHGGKDPGAVGSGTTEKEVAFEVSKRVQAKLKAAGAKTVMTREGDTYPSLGDRVEIAEKNYGDMFVSIHANSASASAKGTETFYDTSGNLNGEESKKLAQEIQKQIISLTNTYDRGIKDKGFYVIRNNEMVSVLVELAFISNAGDLEKLKSSKYHELFAEAIYRGIVEYYKK